MEKVMPTNLAIEDALLKKALKAGGFRTKKETVTKALEEFIQRRQQRKVLRAMGSIEFRKDWQYKAERRDREPRR